jgi:hypothetical protein
MLSLIIPIIVMKKLSGPEALGPLQGMLVALIFPLVHVGLELRRHRKLGFVPLLGVTNILLTGAFVIFEVGGVWFAVKEASVPLLIGIALFVSQKFEKPLVKAMFINDNVVNLPVVNEAIDRAGVRQQFEEEVNRAGYLIAFSFFISAVLNFAFAYFIVVSPPGTEAFNSEVGTMQASSFAAILLSCSSLMIYALYRVGNRLRKDTGLAWEQILKTH